MAKIYNEIVIDMNPESPTFEETLYEDSFEYSGDMMLMQDYPTTASVKQGDGTYIIYEWDVANSTWTSRKANIGVEGSAIFSSEGDFMSAKDEIGGQAPKEWTVKYDSYTSEMLGEDTAKESTRTSTDWGAANISKDDFTNADGSPKTIQEIYNILDDKLPGVTGKDLVDYIKEVLPKYEGVSEKELGFIEEQYGGAGANDQYDYNNDGVLNTLDVNLAPADQKQTIADLVMKGTKIGGTSFAESISGQAAEASKQTDLYGLQKEAGKVGKQMSQAYGSGMGAGMRGAIAGQKTLAKGAEQTYDKYGLAKQKAGLAGEKARYGLEQKAEQAFETDVLGTIQADWLTASDDPDSSIQSEDSTTTEWGSFDYREGGKVPTEGESFSYFLTQLPEAGGS